MWKQALLVLTLAAYAGAANAQNPLATGNQLLEQCERNSQVCIVALWGLSAMHGLYQVADRQPFFCAPQGATIGQAIRIVVAFGRANPQTLHEPAEVLFTRAMIAAFPCAH